MTSPDISSVQSTIRYPAKLYEKVRKAARREGLSVAAWMRQTTIRKLVELDRIRYFNGTGPKPDYNEYSEDTGRKK